MRLKLDIMVSLVKHGTIEGDKENIRRFVEGLEEEGFEVRLFEHVPLTH